MSPCRPGVEPCLDRVHAAHRGLRDALVDAQLPGAERDRARGERRPLAPRHDPTDGPPGRRPVTVMTSALCAVPARSVIAVRARRGRTVVGVPEIAGRRIEEALRQRRADGERRRTGALHRGGQGAIATPAAATSSP